MKTFIVDEYPIIFEGRVVIKLIFPDGKVQPFYKSSGLASGKKDVWFPFDGVDIYAYWFDKARYKVKDEAGNPLPLHRFGSTYLKEISDFLSVLDVSKAQKVLYPHEVNQYLFGSNEIKKEILENLL